MDFGSGKSVNAGFPEKKTGQFSGGPGGNPREPFCLLLGLGPKEGGRAFDIFFYSIAFFLRGHTEKPFFQVWPEGHLLSSHEERRQRRAKGESPLESRAILIFRAIVGHHNGG